MMVEIEVAPPGRSPRPGALLQYVAHIVAGRAGRVADAPTPVDYIHISATREPADLEVEPVTEDAILVPLGSADEEQAEAICARLAASGLLPSAFDAELAPGQIVARVADDADTVVERLTEIAHADISADLPKGWARYAVHDAVRRIVTTRVWPAGDTAGLAALLEGHDRGYAVWPHADPDAAVVVNPEQYMRRLADGPLAPPVAAQVLAAAAWRAGLHNVRAIAIGLRRTTKTVYTYLRSAGIDPPTDRRDDH